MSSKRGHIFPVILIVVLKTSMINFVTGWLQNYEDKFAQFIPSRHIQLTGTHTNTSQSQATARPLYNQLSQTWYIIVINGLANYSR